MNIQLWTKILKVNKRRESKNIFLFFSIFYFQSGKNVIYSFYIQMPLCHIPSIEWAQQKHSPPRQNSACDKNWTFVGQPCPAVCLHLCSRPRLPSWALKLLPAPHSLPHYFLFPESQMWLLQSRLSCFSSSDDKIPPTSFDSWCPSDVYLHSGSSYSCCLLWGMLWLTPWHLF